MVMTTNAPHFLFHIIHLVLNITSECTVRPAFTITAWKSIPVYFIGKNGNKQMLLKLMVSSWNSLRPFERSKGLVTVNVQVGSFTKICLFHKKKKTNPNTCACPVSRVHWKLCINSSISREATAWPHFMLPSPGGNALDFVIASNQLYNEHIRN